MPIAVTEAITTLADAELLLSLSRAEAPGFFPEWRTDLPEISPADRNALDELWRRYLYQRSQGQLLEGTVMLLLASPLLAIAGLYDPPFTLRAEESLQLTIDDGEEILQGRIDVLVLREQFWIVVLEAKKTALSVWTALPQTLAYLAANPQPEQPSFGLMTNGDELVFAKLRQEPQRQYALSRAFAPLAAQQELGSALQILRRLARAIAAPP